jgi:hypothetical protein
LTKHHPITPPPELVEQWIREKDGLELVVTRAAKWGADQELEECLSYASDQGLSTSQMRNHRRPKPPSLKQQAMAVLDDIDAQLGAAHYNVLLRALEALPDD